MKKIIPLIGAFIFLASCSKDEIFLPETQSCVSSINYIPPHPKSDEFQSILDKYKKKGLVGISVFINQDGLQWEGSSGFASLEQKIELEPCHLMYSASVGKMYCATAVLLLAEQKKIHLDSKIDLYLDKELTDKIANGHTATIRQLLNHTSGIPNVDDDLEFGTNLLNAPFSLTRDGILKFMYGKKAIANAGEKHFYSSTNYELLTKLIDKVTGVPHQIFYQEELIDKFDLYDTYYKTDRKSIANRLPNSYFERFGNGKLENISEVNYHLQNTLTGSDGIIATPRAYANFITKLLNGFILNKESLAQMKKFVPTDDTKTEGYGLGLRAKNSPYGLYLGHGGRSLGAGIDLYYFEDKNTTICISTNLGTYVETDLVNQFNGSLFTEIVNAVLKK